MRPPWQLLRTKTDEITEDDDWAVDGNLPALAICGQFEASPGHGLPPYTGIDVRVLGFSAGAQVARGANTCTLDCIEVDEVAGITYVGDIDETGTTDVPLGERCYFPLNGSSRFTIRISDNTAIAGVTELRVLWRPVSR